MKTSCALAFLASVLPLGAITFQEDLISWWLMGEQATVDEDEQPPQDIAVTAVPDHSGNSADAEGVRLPQRLAGNAFDPFPFADSFAVQVGGTGPGDANFIRVPAHASLDMGTDDFSISLWARVEGGNGGRFTKLFQRIGHSFYQAETDGAGGLVWNIRGGGGNAEISTAAIFTDSNWHHIVLTRNGALDQLQAFADGVLLGQGIFPNDNDPNSVGPLDDLGPLAIGAEASGANPFNGQIDDFRIYDGALTAEDAAALYNGGAGDFSDPAAPVTMEDNIKGWWLMGENATVDIPEPVASGDILSVPNQVIGGVSAEATGAPQRVPGKDFEPFFLGSSAATQTSQGNYLIAPDDPSLNLGTDDFSLSFWARTPTGNGGRFNKLFQRMGAGFLQAETDGRGGIIWNIRASGNAEINTDPIFNDPNWHHIVLTRDNANNKLGAFVDGAPINVFGISGTPNGVFDPLDDLGPFAIGAEVNGNGPFSGQIDDFRIYRRALTEEDAAALYNDGLGDFERPIPPNLNVELLGDGQLRLTWDSQPRKLYTVRSVVDLAAGGEPLSWPTFGEHADIPATPPLNSLTIPHPGDDIRFFVVEEFDAPPETLESFDFETAEGWTTGTEGAPGAAGWQRGIPVNAGPPAAHGGANCFGTVIGGSYPNASGGIGESWLRSPFIDLTGVQKATLSYFHWADFEGGPFDWGSVRVLDAFNGTELAVLDPLVEPQGILKWEEVKKTLPAAALDKIVILEFRFFNDDGDVGPQAGWYLDDLTVTTP